MKSIYYYIFLYIYKNTTEENRDFMRYILENERIKRGMCSKLCRTKII